MAERLRVTAGGRPVPSSAGPIRFTASFGVAQRAPAQDSLEELLARADAALYQAKNAGRDRVMKDESPAASA
jgi:diguanylate cyclase (GGDEF)-like protein